MSASVQTGQAPVEGGEVWYQVAGEGPAVLLMHAGICDHRMWDDVMAPLAEHYRVVRYDLRGYRRSKPPAQRFAHHRDARDLLDHLEIDQAALICCSFAGAIGIEVALAFPDRVSKLIPVGGGVHGLKPPPDLAAAMDEADAAGESGDIARAVELELRIWVDGPPRTAAEVDPTFRERVREMNHDAWLVEWPEGCEMERLEPSASEQLEEVAAPTLVVVGAFDQPYMLAIADELARRIPNARQVVMPGTSHLPPMEVTGEFLALTLPFLGAGVG